MPHRLITDSTRFEELCQHIRQMGEVAFDTEFLSEHTYRPQLCLLQFATRERSAAVDPFEILDLSSWWKLMASPEIAVVVHGGRERVRFLLWGAAAPPGPPFLVRVAGRLMSRNFPPNYNA